MDLAVGFYNAFILHYPKEPILHKDRPVVTLPRPPEKYRQVAKLLCSGCIKIVFSSCRFAVWLSNASLNLSPKKVTEPVKGGTGSRTRSAGSKATEHRTGEDSRRSPCPCWHIINTRPTGVRGISNTVTEKYPYGRGASVVQRPLPIRRGLGFGATPQAWF